MGYQYGMSLRDVTTGCHYGISLWAAVAGWYYGLPLRGGIMGCRYGVVLWDAPTDALGVPQVLLGLLVGFQLIALIADVDPFVLHDLLWGEGGVNNGGR